MSRERIKETSSGNIDILQGALPRFEFAEWRWKKRSAAAFVERSISVAEDYNGGAKI